MLKNFTNLVHTLQRQDEDTNDNKTWYGLVDDEDIANGVSEIEKLKSMGADLVSFYELTFINKEHRHMLAAIETELLEEIEL